MMRTQVSDARRPLLPQQPMTPMGARMHQTSQTAQTEPYRPGPWTWLCGAAPAAWAALTPPSPQLQPGRQATLGRSGSKGVDRDFKAYPAVLDISEMPSDLWVVSDIHADCDRFIALLAAHKLVTQDDKGVPRWSAGPAGLLILGDMIDKGPKNLATLATVRRLQQEAKEAGGRLEALIGNHEASFLAEPINTKASGPGGINFELWAQGIDPKEFASEKNPDGAWLANLPLAVRWGVVFGSHGGDTNGRTLWGLEQALTTALKEDGFGADLIIGVGGIARSRDWYGRGGRRGIQYANILHVWHLLYGHDPQTVGPRGEIVPFAKNWIVKIDTGMSRGIDYSKKSEGELLHLHRVHGEEVMEACPAKGPVRRLAVCKHKLTRP